MVKMRLGGKSTSALTQKKKSVEDMSIIYQYSLPGMMTLAFKITRKIPQHLKSRVLPRRYQDGKLIARTPKNATVYKAKRNDAFGRRSFKQMMSYWFNF